MYKMKIIRLLELIKIISNYKSSKWIRKHLVIIFVTGFSVKFKIFRINNIN